MMLVISSIWQFPQSHAAWFIKRTAAIALQRTGAGSDLGAVGGERDHLGAIKHDNETAGVIASKGAMAMRAEQVQRAPAEHGRSSAPAREEAIGVGDDLAPVPRSGALRHPHQ